MLAVRRTSWRWRACPHGGERRWRRRPRRAHQPARRRTRPRHGEPRIHRRPVRRPPPWTTTIWPTASAHPAGGLPLGRMADAPCFRPLGRGWRPGIRRRKLRRPRGMARSARRPAARLWDISRPPRQQPSQQPVGASPGRGQPVDDDGFAVVQRRHQPVQPSEAAAAGGSAPSGDGGQGEAAAARAADAMAIDPPSEDVNEAAAAGGEGGAEVVAEGQQPS